MPPLTGRQTTLHKSSRHHSWGVVFTGEHNVYGDTDFQQIKRQTYSLAPAAITERGPESLELTAALFPSADAAARFVTSSQSQWGTCAENEVQVTLGFENARGFRLGSVQRQGDLITVSMASWSGLSGLHTCQQPLGARGNIVVETPHAKYRPSPLSFNPNDLPDPAWATFDAERIANATLAKANP